MSRLKFDGILGAGGLVVTAIGGIAMCSLSLNKQQEAVTPEIEEICSKVNNDNWHTFMWGERSAQDVCRQNWVLLTGPNASLLCSFGGLPYLCQTTQDGVIVGRRFGGAPAFEIYPADRLRVGNSLIIFGGE